ncbi:DUF3017 domain-containing protein [Cellulomonas gilvus]|uniref:DUF3017 domain-containing protein n=1 Tax=Cellulomonas gilvus (strain ATCC 13127 / NRRL B-14078) TaxID=593907 RepID=F8A030_CELGA|nr:DUF3017 domain-containing protein [Cellulomonas gilvus]AEI11449.1 hypothetical protein Celgi_0930 [Cellulomonas gilvus ATCC 13127]
MVPEDGQTSVGQTPARAEAGGADDPLRAAGQPVPAGSGPIPVAEQRLDPRAIARASLQASRNASLWWTATGVVLTCVVALVAGTAAGAVTLAAVLGGGAVVRAVRPSPGPVALAVRAKVIDVTVLALLAVALVVLALLLPTVAA